MQPQLRATKLMCFFNQLDLRVTAFWLIIKLPQTKGISTTQESRLFHFNQTALHQPHNRGIILHPKLAYKAVTATSKRSAKLLSLPLCIMQTIGLFLPGVQ